MRTAMVGLGVAAVIAVAPTPAWADDGATGSDFSEHVRACQRTMGFNGTHNPGMHDGFSGWDPEHIC